MNGFRAATAAFRDAYMHPDGADATDLVGLSSLGDAWSRVDARRLRYSINWAFYSFDQYRDLHKWARKYRSDYGLYRNTRSIYSPTYRLVELHVAHIHGGPLDLLAGDGKARPTAIPITTNDERLREAIGQLWKTSRWGTWKDVWIRWGVALGDVALTVEDDPIRGEVALCPVHPRSIRDVELDTRGNVRGYCREEMRLHPKEPRDGTGNPRYVLYSEHCSRGPGQDIRYQTYLDGKPYAWNGNSADWVMPYGFVPMVLTQHLNVGLPWGVSEAHAAMARTREIDDLGSKLNDQVRKLVEAPWLITGAKGGNADFSTNRNTNEATPEGRQADREESLLLFIKGENVRAQAMVAEVKIAEVSEHIGTILAEMAQDYPELRYDTLRATGSVTGQALREARKPAEQKFQLRRGAYDEALVRAQQMAVSIGGMRGYDGYQGFSLDSFKAGALDHQIGNRSVFGHDPVEALEEESLFWSVADQALKAGVPLPLFLKRHGWSDEQISEIETAGGRPLGFNP